MTEQNTTMEQLISLCKRRGFIFQGSEIYGGLAGTWDYGPLGIELKRNIQTLWWNMFVSGREDMYGVDAAILMNQNVWKASGHVGGFSDPLVQCRKCNSKFRVDHLSNFSQEDFNVVKKEHIIKIEEFISSEMEKTDNIILEANQKNEKAKLILDLVDSENFSDIEKKTFIEVVYKLLDESTKLINQGKSKVEINRELFKIINQSKKYIGFITQVYLNRFVSCTNCFAKDWDIPNEFNMMFQTNIGAVEDSSSISYLRPETAQGMFVNFKNVVDSMRPKLPFGLGQIGKAFRNEIAPRDFIFRSREFEQMEIEYFVEEKDWEKKFSEWIEAMYAWMKAVGIPKESVHELEVAPEDLAHYSKRTMDFEFDFPFGRKELYGLAYRTNFDLNNHATASTVPLYIVDDATGEKITPHCIEPTFGVDRTVLAVLASAYTSVGEGDDKHVVLKLKPSLAPYKACVSPLLKNKPELVEKAREVFVKLKKEFGAISWDDNGNIGKRYRRADEIGTPYCIVIDFDTLGENPDLLDTVTIRDRDTGEQERKTVAELIDFLKEKLTQ